MMTNPMKRFPVLILAYPSLMLFPLWTLLSFDFVVISLSPGSTPTRVATMALFLSMVLHCLLHLNFRILQGSVFRPLLLFMYDYCLDDFTCLLALNSIFNWWGPNLYFHKFETVHLISRYSYSIISCVSPLEYLIGTSHLPKTELLCFLPNLFLSQSSQF